jgi:hypothetical protein
MLDMLCGVHLTREEITARNYPPNEPMLHPARSFQYGDKCNKPATHFFRIERRGTTEFLLGRCDAHCKGVSVGLNDKVITKLTPEEALVCEIHDA